MYWYATEREKKRPTVKPEINNFVTHNNSNYKFTLFIYKKHVYNKPEAQNGQNLRSYYYLRIKTIQGSEKRNASFLTKKWTKHEFGSKNKPAKHFNIRNF